VALLAFASIANQIEADRWPPEEEVCRQRDNGVSQEDNMVAVGGDRIIVTVVIFVDPDNVSIHVKQEHV
jgi:hypothetical protein